MSKLSLPDLLRLHALRRAGRDVLTWRAGQYFDDGHVVGVLRSEVLAALAEDGRLSGRHRARSGPAGGDPTRPGRSLSAAAPRARSGEHLTGLHPDAAPP